MENTFPTWTLSKLISWWVVQYHGCSVAPAAGWVRTSGSVSSVCVHRSQIRHPERNMDTGEGEDEIQFLRTVSETMAFKYKVLTWNATFTRSYFCNLRQMKSKLFQFRLMLLSPKCVGLCCFWLVENSIVHKMRFHLSSHVNTHSHDWKRL